jgi:hypothetical protein
MDDPRANSIRSDFRRASNFEEKQFEDIKLEEKLDEKLLMDINK